MVVGRLPADPLSRPPWPSKSEKLGALELETYFNKCTEENIESRPSISLLLREFQQQASSHK